MKHFILICSFLFVCQSLFAALTVEGTFQGKNIYVQNPMTDEGGFCVDSIYINDTKHDINVVVSAFEIDFKSMNFQIGDSIHLIIYHKLDCKPKILNTFHYYPRRSSPVSKLEVRNDTLFFSVKGIELAPIFLETYRWNRWIKLDTIIKNSPTQFHYLLKTISHSGENKFRVTYPTSVGSLGVSETVNYFYKQADIKYSVDRKTRVVTFSEPTNYEVYTVKGNVLTSGFGTSINLSDFSIEVCDNNDELFYLNLDNRNEKLKMRHSR